MKVRCPHCGGTLKAPDSALGRKGRCPRCKGVVPMVPVEEAEIPELELAGASAIRESPTAQGLVERSSPAFDPNHEGQLAMAPPDDDEGYGLSVEDDEPAIPPARVVAVPVVEPTSVGPRRMGKDDEPGHQKSIAERQQEIDDLRAGGRSHLWQTRLVLIGLGLLMVVLNYYFLTTVDETIQGFRSAAAASGRNIDPARVEEIAVGLRRLLLIECGLYLALGIALCVLSIWISWAPKLSTYIALGAYVAVWVFDLLAIQAFFGDLALGQSIFSIQTIVKFSIASGLWYGTRVGTEYEEQVVRPMRQLKKDKAEAFEKWKAGQE